MKGALPPSSSDTFFTVPAHCAMQLLADLGRAGEGELAHHAGSTVISPPMAAGVAGDDVEHARRNAGALGQLRQRQRRVGRLRRPACTTRCSRRPAPGPTLRVIMAAGKFQGVIAATTPIGCLQHDDALVGLVPGMMSP